MTTTCNTIALTSFRLEAATNAIGPGRLIGDPDADFAAGPVTLAPEGDERHSWLMCAS